MMDFIDYFNEKLKKEVAIEQMVKGEIEPIMFGLIDRQKNSIYLMDAKYRELDNKLNSLERLPPREEYAIYVEREKRREEIDIEIKEKEEQIKNLPAPPEGCRYNIDGTLRRYPKEEYKDIYKNKFKHRSINEIKDEYARLNAQYMEGKFEHRFQEKIEVIKELLNISA